MAEGVPVLSVTLILTEYREEQEPSEAAAQAARAFWRQNRHEIRTGPAFQLAAVFQDQGLGT